MTQNLSNFQNEDSESEANDTQDENLENDFQNNKENIDPSVRSLSAPPELQKREESDLVSPNSRIRRPFSPLPTRRNTI